MAFWSAENATKAFLGALKMGKRGKEPDVAEFLSAMAAGNNAQLMVMASAGTAGSTTLSLVAAACQTSGQVVCILPTLSNFIESKGALGPYADCIKFVIGDAKTLLLNEYKGADFVLIDCNIGNHKGIFRAAQEGLKHDGRGIIVGYNALHKGSWCSDFKTHFLPIGDGLLVTRIGCEFGKGGGGSAVGLRKRSKWVTTIDKCTGEEHAFRVTSPQQHTEA